MTGALRPAYDLARRLGLIEAVLCMDSLAARAGFAPTRLLELRNRYPGAARRGVRRSRTPNAPAPVRDLDRQARLTRLGWRVIRFTAGAVFRRPAEIVARVAR